MWVKHVVYQFHSGFEHLSGKALFSVGAKTSGGQVPEEAEGASPGSLLSVFPVMQLRASVLPLPAVRSRVCHGDGSRHTHRTPPCRSHLYLPCSLFTFCIIFKVSSNLIILF